MSEAIETNSKSNTTNGRPDLKTEVLNVLQAKIPKYGGETGKYMADMDLEHALKAPINRSTVNLKSIFEKMALKALQDRDIEANDAMSSLASQYNKDSQEPENCLWRHYSNLPEFSSSRERRVDEPLEIPRSDSPVWDELQKFVQGYPEAVGMDSSLAGFIVDKHSKNTNQELIAGSLNLVNTVIRYQDMGHPLGAVVFMDKSARNGAVVYRTFWKEFFADEKIPSKYIRPNERFINVGNEDPKLKLHSSVAHSFLADQYRAEDFGSHALVVDEWMASGDSSAIAAGVLHTTTGVSFDRIEQFTEIPPWVHTKLSGVADSEDDAQNRVLMININKLDQDQVRRIINLRNSVGKDKFVETINKIINSEDNKNYQEIKEILEIVSVSEDFSFVNLGQTLEDVIKSAGGLLTQPLEDSKDRVQASQYRRFLVEVSRAYVRLSSGVKVEDILAQIRSTSGKK